MAEGPDRGMLSRRPLLPCLGAGARHGIGGIQQQAEGFTDVRLTFPSSAGLIFSTSVFRQGRFP